MGSSSQTSGHSSNNNRRQDQQSSSTNSATVSTSNVQRASKSNLVFNTFRSHLSVLRASVAEKDEDHHAPAMMASNYNHYHANANRLREDDMSYAEKLFVSPEDELVGENEWQKRMYGIAEAVSEDSDEQPPQLPQQPIFQHPRHKQPHHVKAEFNFEDATKCTSADQDDLLSIRTDECTQVTKLKRRRRGRKARDASMVGAFVTFLKALFGIGMLSNPAVLGEVGLILGTFCHLFIVVGCAFACYLLLMSRQIAKQEVALKQQQHEFERRRWESMTPLRTRMAMLLGKSPRSQSFNKRKSGPTEVEMTTPSTPTRLSKTPKRTNASARESKSCVTDDYHLMTSSPSMPPSPPPPPPPEKPQGARLMTYGDVVKYLAGERASVFMVFTIVAVHLMFASGMVHLAVENLCYVIGMNRLGWSVVEQEYIYDDDLANKFNYYQYTFNSNDDYNNYYNNNNDDGGGYNDDVGYNDDYYARFLKSESSSGSEDAGQSEELLYLQWQGADFTERLSMASMLFPVILLLLQIPSLRELTTISSFGLLTYAFGCIGTMMYVSFVTTSGHPFQDHPEDIWTAKWRGIPTYVATTVYAIEGINLALPTVVSVEGIQRVWKLKKNASNPWLKDGSPLRVPLGSPVGGNEENGSNGSIRPDLSVYIVCGAVFFYGFITLIVSWVGLAGGLGGGIGTFHEELGCRDVTYCLNSSGARRIYMLSLAVALILTLPVILYPSTEMLEILLDEREEKRRKRMEAALAALDNPVDQPQDGDKSMRNRLKTSRQKSILQVTSRDDDDSQANGREFELGNVQPMGSNEHSPFPPHKQVSESSSITTEPTHEKEQTNESISPIIGDESIISSPTDKSNSRSSPRLRRVKYWKLRMFLAGTIIVIGTIEGSFPQVLKVAEVIRGVGLSIAGLIFPPLLYMSAVGGRFGFPMAAAMSLLVGLGLFNIVLVLMSAFGGKDYIMEESNFYELDWSED